MKARKSALFSLIAVTITMLLLAYAATDGRGAVSDDGYHRLTGEWQDYGARILAVKEQTPFVRCSDGVRSLGWEPASASGLFVIPDGVEVFWCE